MKKRTTTDYAALLKKKMEYAQEEADDTGIIHYVTLADGSAYGGATYQVHRADRFNHAFKSSIKHVIEPAGGL